MRDSKHVLLALLAMLSVAGAPASGGQEVESLRAFAKLYGYVRFFHPSDEASRVDWDKFAVYGAEKVRGAADVEELEDALEELFSPIAPTLAIYRAGEDPPPPPSAAADGVLVAWQHRGVELGNPGPYRSLRTHRSPHDFGTITAGVPAEPYQGQEIRLRAAVRAEVSGAGNQGQLWLRVDRPDRQMGFFDNMDDRPITSSEWQVYEIAGKVADDAQRIYFGGFLKGEGKVHLDAFELSARASDGEWQPIELSNPGFEASSEELVDWGGGGEGYALKVAAGNAHEGRQKAAITAVDIKLFDQVPAAGEVLHVELGGGLACRLPLALRLPRKIPELDDDSPAAKLLAELDALGLSSSDPADRTLWPAAVVIAWNVFQHFYPYFDVVPTDWDSELTRALASTLEAEDAWSFYLTLKRLVASLHDGHGRAHHSALDSTRGYFPLRVDEIEGQVVVTVSEAPGIERGDVVVGVDGIEVERALLAIEESLSGSPQWNRYRSLASLGWGEKDTTARIRLQRQAGPLEVAVTRQPPKWLKEPRREPVEELAGGAFYVDLSRASIDEINAEIDALAKAPGVVFDLRGYPQGNHDVIRHLIDEPVRSAKWMKPLAIYPDRGRRVGYDTSGRWLLEPAAPRFRGRIVFLTDGSAISYAESFLGIIEHYRLAEIVGQPTAGANGNVNPFTLPGGFRVTWTGMRVLKHDDSQHHLVGIQPTVRCRRTLAGLREGRDEYLEKALELIGSPPREDQDILGKKR